MDPKNITVKVRACYDYQAKGPEELSFSAGDIITNVVKQDHGWWKGDFNGNIGWYFPSNFVEEIEDEDQGIQSFDEVNQIIFCLINDSIFNIFFSKNLWVT
jgi:hypothetical protein